MLTPEQIKKLKPGDPIVIHTTLDCFDSDGEACFLTPNCCGDDCIAYIKPECVSLPPEKPKYDPCRLFKEGDKVKPAERYGRKTPKLNYKAEYTVTASEDDYGAVGIEYFNGDMTVCVSVPFYWLELVTPVEELEPYVTLDHIVSKSIEIKNSKTNEVEAVFYYGEGHAYTFETAAHASCVERDRLNAERRKEHSND